MLEGPLALTTQDVATHGLAHDARSNPTHTGSQRRDAFLPYEHSPDTQGKARRVQAGGGPMATMAIMTKHDSRMEPVDHEVRTRHGANRMPTKNARGDDVRMRTYTRTKETQSHTPFVTERVGSRWSWCKLAEMFPVSGAISRILGNRFQQFPCLDFQPCCRRCERVVG